MKRFDRLKEFGEDWYTGQVAHMSPEYQRAIRRALEKDIYPAIGNKRLTDVTPGDVLAICDRNKARGAPKMALSTRNVIKQHLYQESLFGGGTHPGSGPCAGIVSSGKPASEGISCRRKRSTACAPNIEEAAAQCHSVRDGSP